MAAACGFAFTAAVTEKGKVCVWDWDDGCNGRDDWVADDNFVLIAAGLRHAACVAADGGLYTWGNGDYGQLGHGDEKGRRRPTRLCKEFLSSPAIMVACGDSHTLVLTDAYTVLTCGYGSNGRLGHGDTMDKMRLQLVTPEYFGGAQIVLVAAGRLQSVAAGAGGGGVFTWGCGAQGCLGHNDEVDRLVPTQIVHETFGAVNTVLVAAGAAHTVAVSDDGMLWAWGYGAHGQLGLGDSMCRLIPTRAGSHELFGDLRVVMAACSDDYTLAVTEDCALWACGDGPHNSLPTFPAETLVMTRVDAQYFNDEKIVTVAGGADHSIALTQNGALYTWGTTGFGHNSTGLSSLPTCIAPHHIQGERVGRWHRLPLLCALAFAMGTHDRLGSSNLHTASAAANTMGCAYVMMPGDLVKRILETCQWCPHGRAGNLQGLRRLLGSGICELE